MVYTIYQPTKDLDESVKVEDLMARLGSILFANPEYFARQDKKRATKKANRGRTWGSVYKEPEETEEA